MLHNTPAAKPAKTDNNSVQNHVFEVSPDMPRYFFENKFQ